MMHELNNDLVDDEDGDIDDSGDLDSGVSLRGDVGTCIFFVNCKVLGVVVLVLVASPSQFDSLIQFLHTHNLGIRLTYEEKTVNRAGTR